MKFLIKPMPIMLLAIIGIFGIYTLVLKPKTLASYTNTIKEGSKAAVKTDGAYVQAIDSSVAYSEGFTFMADILPNFNKITAISLTADIKNEKYDTQALLVLEYTDTSGKFLGYKAQNINCSPGMRQKWHTVTLYQNLDYKLKPGNIIKCYIWNAQKTNGVCLKEMKVEFLK